MSTSNRESILNKIADAERGGLGCLFVDSPKASYTFPVDCFVHVWQCTLASGKARTLHYLIAQTLCHNPLLTIVSTMMLLLV